MPGKPVKAFFGFRWMIAGGAWGVAAMPGPAYPMMLGEQGGVER
jgi:hypothetical protein